MTEGDPAAGNLVACGPTTVGFSTSPGQTYYVMAFSDSATNGGQLEVTFDEAPPAPEATVTVDPQATAFKDGSAKLTGTYSCTNADDFASDVDGTLTQQVGRVKITGDFFVNPLQCDGAMHTWEAIATSQNGLFRGGKGATVAFSVRLRSARVRARLHRAGREDSTPARSSPHSQSPDAAWSRPLASARPA